jgi:hypothetical protein
MLSEQQMIRIIEILEQGEIGNQAVISSYERRKEIDEGEWGKIIVQEALGLALIQTLQEAGVA